MQLAVVGQGHIKHPLVKVTLFITPAFNDLQSIQMGAVRILDRTDEERGCRAWRRVGQIAAHGDPLCVPDIREIRTFRVIFSKFPSPEKAQENPWPGRGISLFSPHAVEDSFPRVLPGPDGDIACSTCLPSWPRCKHAFGAGFIPGKLAPEVVFRCCGQGRVGIRAPNHAEFEWVAAMLLLLLQPKLEGGTGVFELDLVNRTAGIGRSATPAVPGFKVCERVIRRKQRMGLAVPLDLRHFQQRLPAGPSANVSDIKRFPERVLELKHHARGQVAVVGNGQNRSACAFLICLEKRPEVLHMGTVIG